MPSDTFFTQSPEWGWLVVLYFFFGGLAGGSYFIASLIDLFGHRRDMPLARMGYYVSLLCVAVCPILLVADLSRPERFWHMLLQNHTLLPAFKYWSPISIGSWCLLIFSGFSFLSVLGALADDNRLRWRPLLLLRHSPLNWVIAAVGGAAGFFLAGYTGVLLNVTNRALWGDNQLLGLLFICSAATTAASLLILLSLRRGAAAPDAVHRLTRLETWCSLLELAVLAMLVASLGQVARVWLSGWGVLLLVGVVLLGILVPVVLHWRPRLLGNAALGASSALALLGGLVLRAVIVLSAQSV